MTSPKTILITGATDGIGLATARQLAPLGHTLLLHGRNPAKLAALESKKQEIERLYARWAELEAIGKSA